MITPIKTGIAISCLTLMVMWPESRAMGQEGVIIRPQECPPFARPPNLSAGFCYFIDNLSGFTRIIGIDEARRDMISVCGCVTEEPPPPLPPEPPPQLPPEPPPQPPPSSNEALSNTYGVPLTADRNGLFFADSLFQGPRGAKLREAVSATAAEFGIGPGLLAITMAAEVRAGRGAVAKTFTSTGPVQNQEIGLDYWHSDRIRVMQTVPVREARDIRSTELLEHFINEAGKDTGPKHEFPNGPTALRAMAATLRYGEIRLSRDRQVGLEAWNNLPTGTRFAIARAYYNGKGVGLDMAWRAAKGQNVLVPSGPVIDPVTKKVRPRRAATVRAGQALRLSRAIFHFMEITAPR